MSYTALNVVSIQIKKKNHEKLKAWVSDINNLIELAKKHDVNVVIKDHLENDEHFIQVKRYRKEWFDIFFETHQYVTLNEQYDIVEDIAETFCSYVSLNSINSWCCEHHESLSTFVDDDVVVYYEDETERDDGKWPRHLGMYFWNWVNLDEI
ncbi:hypothetical protein [Klebsiella pneumoniae]|uniref:hypothetical protein n=1 Tax=Klebsiella pneumoniae TaxID=573 RepID=UPI000B4CCDAA|nr:hypothetical protein [Klebsiella pneumoniae]NBF32819.1 hypothetical protein [Klebsiella pneumoniae]OWQ33098.1 hypothetical protein B7462_00160 [Klebsiella pneumoniae]